MRSRTQLLCVHVRVFPIINERERSTVICSQLKFRRACRVRVTIIIINYHTMVEKMMCTGYFLNRDDRCFRVIVSFRVYSVKPRSNSANFRQLSDVFGGGGGLEGAIAPGGIILHSQP